MPLVLLVKTRLFEVHHTFGVTYKTVQQGLKKQTHPSILDTFLVRAAEENPRLRPTKPSGIIHSVRERVIRHEYAAQKLCTRDFLFLDDLLEAQQTELEAVHCLQPSVAAGKVSIMAGRRGAGQMYPKAGECVG